LGRSHCKPWTRNTAGSGRQRRAYNYYQYKESPRWKLMRVITPPNSME
jgi:hypothetical protein